MIGHPCALHPTAPASEGGGRVVSAPTCECVSRMDTSKCPVHGGDTWLGPTAPASDGSAGDVEALAEVIARAGNGYGGIRNGLYGHEAETLARAVLGSDWLAAYTARVVDDERGRVEAAMQERLVAYSDLDCLPTIIEAFGTIRRALADPAATRGEG